jgi:hypothetical protein
MERRYLETVALRRTVGIEPVAPMALFLAAPGGRTISGQALTVCGNVADLQVRGSASRAAPPAGGRPGAEPPDAV